MSDVQNLAMLELCRQMAELEGRITILATAIREIEKIADDHMDYDRSELSAILDICRIGGVKTAIDPA